ncbi:MAG: hypothetical protein ACTSRG_21880 [Candidatus Helarchaeota archaeon]
MNTKLQSLNDILNKLKKSEIADNDLDILIDKYAKILECEGKINYTFRNKIVSLPKSFIDKSDTLKEMIKFCDKGEKINLKMHNKKFMEQLGDNKGSLYKTKIKWRSSEYTLKKFSGSSKRLIDYIEFYQLSEYYDDIKFFEKIGEQFTIYMTVAPFLEVFHMSTKDFESENRFKISDIKICAFKGIKYRYCRNSEEYEVILINNKKFEKYITDVDNKVHIVGLEYYFANLKLHMK